jgi:hypothetical protein
MAWHSYTHLIGRHDSSIACLSCVLGLPGPNAVAARGLPVTASCASLMHHAWFCLDCTLVCSIYMPSSIMHPALADSEPAVLLPLLLLSLWLLLPPSLPPLQ